MARGVKKWAWGYKDSTEMSEGPTRTYSETYYATMYSKFDSLAYIYFYYKCPKHGDQHPVDKSAFVTRVRPSRVDETALVEVTVDYTSAISLPGQNPDPTARPAVITMETRIETIPTLFDSDGKLRVNPVGDLVPGKKKKPFQTFTVRKNVSQIPDWFETLPGSTNRFDFYFFGRNRPARTLQLLDAPIPERQIENGKWYYPLAFKIDQDVDTFDVFEPATSFHELIQTGYVKKGAHLVPEYSKKRILVGSPKEYAKDKQFIDEKGKAIILEKDQKKGGIDLSKIYVQRRRDLTEFDYSVLQNVVT